MNGPDFTWIDEEGDDVGATLAGVFYVRRGDGFGNWYWSQEEQDDTYLIREIARVGTGQAKKKVFERVTEGREDGVRMSLVSTTQEAPDVEV